jgi:hypothetical protein
MKNIKPSLACSTQSPPPHPSTQNTFVGRIKFNTSCKSGNPSQLNNLLLHRDDTARAGRLLEPGPPTSWKILLAARQGHLSSMRPLDSLGCMDGADWSCSQPHMVCSQRLSDVGGAGGLGDGENEFSDALQSTLRTSKFIYGITLSIFICFYIL